MARSSLSRDAIINVPKSIDIFIETMENPGKIKLPERNDL